jgi:hypothetical protein
MKKLNSTEIKAVLEALPLDALKEEIVRRRKVEQAKRHINTAEQALIRAQTKLKAYRDVLKNNGADE